VVCIDQKRSHSSTFFRNEETEDESYDDEEDERRGRGFEEKWKKRTVGFGFVRSRVRVSANERLRRGGGEDDARDEAETESGDQRDGRRER